MTPACRDPLGARHRQGHHTLRADLGLRHAQTGARVHQALRGDRDELGVLRHRDVRDDGDREARGDLAVHRRSPAPGPCGCRWPVPPGRATGRARGASRPRLPVHQQVELAQQAVVRAGGPVEGSGARRTCKLAPGVARRPVHRGRSSAAPPGPAVRIAASCPYSPVPGHSVLKPSRWPEIGLNEYYWPAMNVFPEVVLPRGAGRSMMLPARSPSYWPSFQAAIRETGFTAPRRGPGGRVVAEDGDAGGLGC